MATETHIPATETHNGPAAGYGALRGGVGYAPLRGGWIAITGEDRVRWLNGMVTNSVQALTPGEGAYTFLLSAQGRIQGDGTVWAERERLLLQTAPEQVEAIVALLDRFIIMDDVELQDLSAEMHGLVIAGPEAAAKLAAVGIAARASKLMKRQTVTWTGHELAVLNAYSPLVPRFEVWASSETAIAALAQALADAGAVLCDEDAIEALRIAEATPRYGKDLRDRDLPQETGQTRALHFNKGCYLGQEIVERIRSRGNVHRTFTGFTVRGDTPAPGAAIMADGKQVGEITSVAPPGIAGERLALGFIRREVLDRGLELTYAGGTLEGRGATAASEI